jgi:multiple sugar transport system permease protein/raffinose/stachyose/melibiose transport system permease protein
MPNRHRRTGRAQLAEVVKTAMLLLIGGFVFVPVYFMVVISVKDPVQFAESPFIPTWPLHFENYVRAMDYVGPFIGRTLFVTVVATFLTTLLGSICAFYLAQYPFTGKRVIFAYIIALMMIPAILNLIPLYVLVTQLDGLLRSFSGLVNQSTGLEQLGHPVDLRLLNTLWALILPAVAGGQVMMVFVLRQFFESQPAALFEAARIDGANRLQQYWHVALPLAKPIIGTMMIIVVVALWNDYIWPLVVLQKDHFTVSIGLKFLEGQNYVEYGPLMAGYTLSAIPLFIMFVFAMKLFIEGIASGAIKM